MGLTNAVVANAKKAQEGLEKVTGVAMDWKTASKADRALIRQERKILATKLRRDITRAIQLGEAKMKAVEERANENIATAKKTLMTTISVAVENMADNVFATVQGNRQKIADNYLSLKAYAAAAADKVEDYLKKGKGRNLASIGDLLSTLATVADIKVKPASGDAFGADTIPLVFSGKQVKVKNSLSKINGLVNQYLSILEQVKSRWQMGLGKYLIAKLEIAMQGKGALEVDKVEGHSGNYVFINGHAVGLSAKLNDFENLAVAMRLFEDALHKLTAKTKKFKKVAAKRIEVKPPEWQGN